MDINAYCFPLGIISHKKTEPFTPAEMICIERRIGNMFMDMSKINQEMQNANFDLMTTIGINGNDGSRECVVRLFWNNHIYQVARIYRDQADQQLIMAMSYGLK